VVVRTAAAGAPTGTVRTTAPPETPAAIARALGLDDARAPPIATGDPAHVPVGRYAEAALRSLDLWAAAAPRLVRADNVRSALAFVERGEAPAGIVYASDAFASRSATVAARLPATSHPAIRYPAGLVRGAPPAAAQVLAWLTGPDARAAFAEAGFRPP
jgi:molybdate transport system substrate-binding protein